MSLELWVKHLVQSRHMTQRCPHGYCSYSSSFWSVLLSLGRYISHRFLLVLNQIQIKLHSKDYIHMNALVREQLCEFILPGSISLLVEKLWDLIIKKYARTFQFLRYFIEKSQNSVDSTLPRWMILCARDVLKPVCVRALQCSNALD